MMYTCVRCGKQFKAKHKTAVCQDCHTAICVVCRKEFKLNSPYNQKTCSPKCRGIYRKESGIAKRNAEKARETMLERYGVDNARKLGTFRAVRKCRYCGKEFTATEFNQMYCSDVHYGPCPVCGKPVAIKDMMIGPQACSEACRQARIAQTNLEKYGTKCVFEAEAIKQKSKDTCKQKYGADHYSQTTEYREKFTHTMMERYGTSIALRNPQILDKLRKTCQTKYGVAYNCMRPECRSSYTTISKINLAFNSLLEQNSIVCELEFPLCRFSYDFKIDNVLVEIDPSITHNSAMSIFKDTLPTAPDYHLRKSEVAWKHGYRCIHVFDWDDWHKVVQLLLPTEAVYARKCELQKIDKVTADKFTAEYHISSKCNGQLENYGLFFEGELIEVMTFGKPRYNKNYDYELLRLCTKSGLRIVGGASKLFHRFVVEHPQASVISYCDRAKFTGAVYEQIGMKLVKTTESYKVWSRDDKKITQNLLNQRGYDQLFGTSFGKGTSNEQLMLDNGWLPVYDCGQLVYEYTPQSL